MRTCQISSPLSLFNCRQGILPFKRSSLLSISHDRLAGMMAGRLHARGRLDLFWAAAWIKQSVAHAQDLARVNSTFLSHSSVAHINSG